MSKLVKPKQIHPSTVDNYVLTTVSGLTVWSPSYIFTGNTSASCITDLYITNLHGCSPITVWDNLQTRTSTATGLYSNAFGSGNTASGLNSFVGGGKGNMAIGTQSTVAGGQSNTASSSVSFIGGGQANTASGMTSTIGGGRNNTSSGDYSFLGGGYNNSSTTAYSTIGGGSVNTASGNWSVVAGGNYNTASGNWSSIVGGFTNISSGSYSIVAGGRNNTTSGIESFIGGGQANTASGMTSTIGGGDGNIASGQHSTVSGGYNNTASGLRSAVGGGRDNRATGANSTIAGGGFTSSYINLASGNYSSILGGWGNSATGTTSTIGGGGGNISSNYYSTVAGGQYNRASGVNSIVGGGLSNLASGINSVVVGGSNNKASSTTSFVGGGSSNTASGLHSAVVGGGFNHISTGDYAFIGGGLSNYISGYTSSIIGGKQNSIFAPNTHIVGSNITASTSNHTYVENLNIVRTPSSGSTSDGILVRATDGTIKTVTQTSLSGGGSFTGNTSATCITNIYATNINSCSPLHIQPVNTGNVYIVENGGNVGIGTSSPVSKLDIKSAGNSLSTNALKIFNSDNTNILNLSDSARLTLRNSNDTTYLLMDPVGSGGACEIVTNNTGFKFLNQDGEYWFGRTPAGRVLLFSNGRDLSLSATAGGTANLTITQSTGDINVQPGFKLGVGFSAAPSATVHVRGAGATSATYGLKIEDSATSSLFSVRDDGFVGIGTITPITNLEISVNGNGSKIVSTGYGISTVQGGFISRTARGSKAAPTGVLSGEKIGAFGSAGYHSSGAFHSVSAQMSIYAAETFSATGKGANIIFNTVPIGSVAPGLDRLTITSEGLVGIGTTSPAVRLDVSGDIAHRSLTPASFSTNQNDYSTTGTSFIRLNNTAGSVNITGFADGFDGKRLIIANVGANQIQLMNQNASSTAANRMILYDPMTSALADHSLDPDEVFELIYDAVTSRWRNINSLGPQI